MADQSMANFGSRLRTARKMAGMSLEDLARRLGGIVTRQAISKYEKGRMMPSPDVFERLAGTLDVRPAVEYALRGPSHFRDASAHLHEQTAPARPFSPALSSPGAMAGLGSRKLFRLRRGGHAPESETARYQTLSDPRVSVNCIAEEGNGKATLHGAPLLREQPNPLLEEKVLNFESTLLRIRFREREKLAAKTAVALKLRVGDYVKRCLEVESLLGLECAFENPLVGRLVRTTDDIETAALEVRRAWNLGSSPVTNLLGLLEEKGIRVFELRGVEGFEGLSGNYGHVPFITVNRDFPTDRVRFTAAHELGHILCGFPERESAESLCHAFAGAFLLPRDAVERALMPARRKISLWELKELKENYGISLQAIMYRAHSLGLVTDRQMRNFRETIKANGWLVSEPVEFRGKEQASRLKRLLTYAVAENIIAPERAAVLAGITSVEFLNEIGTVF